MNREKEKLRKGWKRIKKEDNVLFENITKQVRTVEDTLLRYNTPKRGEMKDVTITLEFIVPYELQRTVKAVSVKAAVEEFVRETVPEELEAIVEGVAGAGMEFQPDISEFEITDAVATIHCEGRRYDYHSSPSYARSTEYAMLTEEEQAAYMKHVPHWGEVLREYKEGEWIK